ncbi:MAG: hypothetical protein JNM69_30860 [Archangium sp.]|nr:hypothetical protein [Archangium sp.]
MPPLFARVALATVLLAFPASAHFWLEAPPATWDQAAPYGDPQKTAPCGPTGAGTPTNAVTTVTAGDLVSIRIRETIFHPGHYRVALGLNGPGDLPAAPPVTPTATDACASTTIQSTPAFPVIADGQLRHSTQFAGAQTFSVRIPENVSCTNCTLQVLEFMSSHGAPCFYYHCATLTILPRDAGSAPIDAGSTPNDAGSTNDAGSGAPVADAGHVHEADGGVDPMQLGGCGCTSGSAGPLLLVLAALFAFSLRRA